MRYLQLRILAFMIGVLVHQSQTATFVCNTDSGSVSCFGYVGGANANTGTNEFEFDTTQECTSDGLYCAQITAETDVWQITVTNYGEVCGDSFCPPQTCVVDCDYSSTDAGVNAGEVDGC
jgi:FlaG/FlaF family flagellin (archaellin)